MNIKPLNTIHLFVSALVATFALAFSACQSPKTEVPATGGFKTLEDLEGHSVAVIEGSTSDVLLGDTNNFSNITLLRLGTPTDLIAAVEQGQADCGITDTVVFLTLNMEEHGLATDFNLPGGFDVATAFRPTDEKLCNQFNDFLVQIKSDGTLEEIINRWGAPCTDSVCVPDLEGLDKLKGHPLEVATLADNPPFSFYREGLWTGMEVELMLRFSLYLQRPVHFSGYRFNEVIGVLQQHKADMAAANLFITPDRAKQVLFSHPYYLCKTCCFSRIKK